MRVILAVTTLLLVAVPAVLGDCTTVTDPTTGIVWANTVDDATDTQNCPGGVGTATRLCTAGVFQTPDFSACKCADDVVDGITYLEHAADGTAATASCPDSGTASRVCSATTLNWATPDTSACRCSAEDDSGISWTLATPSATAQSVACPGGVGTATRVCSTTTLTWDASDVSACKCAAETVNGISWTQADTDGNAQNQDCPGVGTASRVCSSTTLDWEDADTSDCRCAADTLTGIDWDETTPSATAQSKSCPGGVGTATRVCSTTTLDWASPVTSACRCAADEDDFGIDWTEATPSGTAQNQACPGGVGTATRVCSTSTLDWVDPVVTACKCAEDTDNDTGLVWPESDPSDTEVDLDCPSAGGATRICSTTTLDWEDADLSDCECAGETVSGVSWSLTAPGSNDTNDCPDSNSTANRFCSDVTLDWEDPDFSECSCAQDDVDGVTFNETATGEYFFAADCGSGKSGNISRYCNATTGTWDDPSDNCDNSSPASVAMPASVSFAILIAGWFAMH